MKLFRLSTYRLFRPDFFAHHKKVSDPFKVMVMSDLHFSYQVTNQKLQAIIKQAKTLAPDYILMPGDLIDTLDMVDENSERQRLLNFLKKLGQQAKVILSVGNHDMYRKPTEGQTGWQYEVASKLFDEIRALDNAFLLDNQVYEDENIYCLGYTQSPKYYRADKGIVEDMPVLLSELESLSEKYLTHLPEKKLKFALIHSPVYLNQPEVKYLLREFDYFISGHMHNGVMPPVLDELINSSRGLISPTKKWAPENSRNTLRTYADKLLVVGALTTFHECIKPFNKLNAFFPSYMALMEFTNKKTYARKPYIKHTYKNW